jgi:nucleoside-diphosphate-sugar epimerase
MDPAISYGKSSFHSVSHSSANFASHSPRLSPGQPWWRISGLHFDGLSSKNCAVLRVQEPRKNEGHRIVFIVSSAWGIEDHGENRRMLIFGMGFAGQYLAYQLKERGWKVFGTCTSEEKRKKLEEKGYEAFIFKAGVVMEELILTGLEKALCEATHIISSIPPSLGAREDPVIFQLGQLLRQAVSRGKLSWIGYLSSTSVYGHWNGDWVDEDSPTKPVDEGALARLDAEKAWISLGQCMDIRIQVFRLGGIYGPGRSALDTIIKQQKLSRSQKTRGSKRYTSRVHVADICQAILASIELSSSGKIYNVVDDHAAPRAEVFSFAKSLLEEKWPCKQWKAIEIGTLTGNTDGEVNKYTSIAEKRVSNRRLKEELKVKLLYPSYMSGLESIIESIDSCPF